MRLLVGFVLVLLLLPAIGTGMLASAISRAPNSKKGETPSRAPAALVRDYRARELIVRVGPPEARLAAWVLEPASGNTRGTVVVLHGVRLDKSSMLPVATALADSGYRAVLVDLRGHGASSGEHLTYGIVEAHDISQLLDALPAELGPLGPIGVHGFSYGAATALQLAASDERIRAVVAVSSFASLRRVVRDYVHWQTPMLEPIVMERWLDSAIDLGGHVAAFDPDAASPANAVSHTHAAVLVMHGADDIQVPPAHALSIFQSANADSKLLILPGESHATLLADASGRVRARSVAWFDSHLSRPRSRDRELAATEPGR